MRRGNETGTAKRGERGARQKQTRGTSVFVLFDKSLSCDDAVDGCPQFEFGENFGKPQTAAVAAVLLRVAAND